MKIISLNRQSFLLLSAIALILLFASCNNDDDNEIILDIPAIENVEIGTGNNEVGVIGRDFHFEMDVVAGDRIEDIQIRILQRSNGTYSHSWSHEVVWDEYKGIKNTNVHKHFNVPEDAAEGEYDFVIIVNDQNGEVLEDTRNISLILPENLPVDPQVRIFNVYKNGKQGDIPFYDYYDNDDFGNETFVKNDTLLSQVNIKNVKGDGIMYLLLIDKALGHYPETVDDIDFSKAIVYDIHQHQGHEEVFTFTNFPYDAEIGGYARTGPEFVIGGANDYNVPDPNPIDGEKAWKNGDYYYGVVYRNTTHDLDFHYYIEFGIEGF